MESTTNEITLTGEQFQILEKVINGLGIKNYSVELSMGAKGNFGGTIIKTDVTSKDAGDVRELNLIIKSASPSELLRKLIHVRMPFLREICLYSKILPEFATLQKEYLIKKPFESYPTYYSSLKIDGEEMLVLQNLRSLGFQERELHLPLDYNHTLLIVKEYARLHALSYALNHHKPELYEEFEQDIAHPIYFDFEKLAMRQLVQQRLSVALKALSSPEDQIVYKKMLDFSRNAIPILKELINSQKTHRVISHIDSGIPNFFFKYKVSSNAPTNVFILDWQLSRFESPAVDLVTFLFSATDKCTRDRYHELISEYYEGMCSFLAELGCEGRQLLPFEVLQQQLKKYGIVGLSMAIMLIYVNSTAIQKLPNIFKDESHSEGFAFLYDMDQEDSLHFNKRVRDTILDFYNLGYNFG